MPTSSIVTFGVFATLAVVFGAIILAHVVVAIGTIYDLLFNQGNEL